MRTTFSITFYCRESKANKQGYSPLEMGININGERLFINLPAKYMAKDFNRKRRPKEIEEAIETFRMKANEVVIDLMRNDMPVTATTVREYMRTGGVKSTTVSSLFDDYLKGIRIRIGVSMKACVYRKYQLVRDFAIDYLGGDREICTITNADMVHLYDTLKAKYKASTAGGYFQKIKTVIQYAIDNGLMKTNPLNGIRIERSHNPVEYLTKEEIKAIENADLDGRLIKARDLLLFQLYGGGMAFADMIHFNPSLMTMQDGMAIYQGKRQKTGVDFTTVILPQALDILHKYNNTLPFISNQKLNEYAKEIARASGLRKNVTTHMMRKTYAQLMLQSGVRLETVSKLLGHTNTKITQTIYCTVNTDIIANEVAAAMQI